MNGITFIAKFLFFCRSFVVLILFPAFVLSLIFRVLICVCDVNNFPGCLTRFRVGYLFERHRNDIFQKLGLAYVLHQF